ncbi:MULTISPECIES: cytochrome c biogenesis protein CcsA [Clostridia]|uniref:cytochrome C assembly family protein n=1 Tax=Clostridia TaxID=186801 RepID=UPI000EA2A6E4|nr:MULTISPECIES: cytochrome c biogenesis protein CcsA [Clostridia]NBJ68679.1 cytochrome C assembly protein [Roseburia sp. 1XD42-34]RKI80646.1 cytochrome C assembly protein [Clostridium sp. 1xD42-85]
MVELKWLYEFILIIYGLSLMGYFIDFVQDNRRVNRIAFWLLSLVWIIQTVFLFYEVFFVKSFPVVSLNDSLFFYSWVLVSISLLANKLFPVNFIVFFTNVFSFFILLLYLLSDAQRNWQVHAVQFVHEIVIAHVTIALISYGFFTLSFLLSVMYLIQYQLIKRKKGLKWMWRFADLNQLDTYAFKTVTIGVPLLLIAIILGIVWAYVSGALFYWVDLKTIGSFFVLAVYIIYLVIRLLKRYRGRAVAMYNTVAFLLLLINFFLFSTLSKFHF